MDPISRQLIWNVLKKYNRNSTIILSTHYLDEAERLGNQLLLLKEGEVIYKGGMTEMKEKYRDK